MRQIIISFESAHVTAKKLADLLDITGCGSASLYLNVPEFCSRFFCPGTAGVFAIDKATHQMVGFVRVFTDNVFTTYISEVCVHPAYQRKGIGASLVKAITERFGHTAIFTEAFSGDISIFTKNSIAPKEKLVACSRRPPFSSVVIH